MAARRRYEQATQDLRDSEQSYRLLADNVTDVISLASADNQRLYVSPSIERILGFAPGELLVTPNYTYMHPDDTEMVQAFITSVTEETGPRTLDYRVFAKDGSVDLGRDHLLAPQRRLAAACSASRATSATARRWKPS